MSRVEEIGRRAPPYDLEVPVALLFARVVSVRVMLELET